MELLNNLQNGVLLILGVAAFGLCLWALVDCLRRPAGAFVAAGKRTKTFWTVIVAVATAIGFVSIFSILGIFGILAVVGASVYLADVRPAVRQYGGGPKRGDRGGRGGNQGPYGPW
ncbi:hypothetical protein FHR75_001222 [Kineococcus radiotolerans]|uniref:Integral membrane protein n=2 Tax=Kineococcus radiotolerans TaxID=131568 RepID=A6W6D5_KINRD|nr:DUF2516 family protein [Kineococcus radiotolerans]ABS02374.1 putative integral membrane protein [Kineococcus radiotolerans SRS30216 = ATCC BAA-149]MBB2900434.1 hypothetical protein [Kineococcus radiotolerans]